MTQNKVWLITGCSTGFGKALVERVLAQSDVAIATARDTSGLKFENTNSANYMALRLDVTDKASIESAFLTAIHKYGRIDVVVNNAGYGLTGVFEAYSEEQIRRQMEVNFFGVLDVTRIALQTMRTQSPPGGMIQQVSSIGGQRGFDGASLYNASKWAVEGFSEAVAQEMRPEWKIKFCIIEPGGFRTDWAGRSMDHAKPNPAYDHLNVKDHFRNMNGQQGGDPIKAAQIMYKLASEEDPPLRIALGSDSFEGIKSKLAEYEQSIGKWEALSRSADGDWTKS